MGSKGLSDEERVAMQQEADKHGPFLWLPIKVRPGFSRAMHLGCLSHVQKAKAADTFLTLHESHRRAGKRGHAGPAYLEAT